MYVLLVVWANYSIKICLKLVYSAYIMGSLLSAIIRTVQF